MNVAVVILNWNGKSLLERFLPSVVLYSKEAAIYVADNASTDSSVEFIKDHFPKVKIIRNKVNGGFAKGYNDALRYLSEEIFVLLNSDVEVSLNWLKPILKEFKDAPNTAAVQPKILDYKNRQFFEYAGAAGGFIDKFGYPYCRGRIFDSIERDEGQYNNTIPVFWASGACMAIRKKSFYAAGEFDEDFFAHQEEIDLCWRLFHLGFDVKATGKSAVYHLGGGTLETMHPKKTFYNFRNSLYALLKNVPEKRVYLLLISRLLLDGVAGVKFMAELKPKHAFSIVKAHFSFYYHFSKMKRKRKFLRKEKKYFQKSSVLYLYYVLRKKKFSDL